MSRRGLVFAGLMILMAGLATGCNKKSGTASASSSAATTQESAADNAAVPPSPRGPVGLAAAPAGATVIENNASTEAILSQLSAELRKYVVRSRSVPKNFDDFIAKSLVQAPPAPEGKKYAIQNQAIVLVKR